MPHLARSVGPICSALPWLLAIGLGTAAHLAWLFEMPPRMPTGAIEEPPSQFREACGCEHRAPSRAVAIPAEQPDFATSTGSPFDIRRVADEVYEVRALALGSPARLARAAHAVPAFAASTFVGYKLDGIARGSWVDAIDLRNGDTIAAIDGEGLDAPSSIVEVVGRFRERGALSLTILREGEAITKVVRLRKG